MRMVMAADICRGVGGTGSCKASKDIIRILEFFPKVTTYLWRAFKWKVPCLKDRLAAEDGLQGGPKREQEGDKCQDAKCCGLGWGGRDQSRG